MRALLLSTLLSIALWAGSAAAQGTCTGEDDLGCDAVYHCDAGACVPDAADGAACDETSDCTSGHCSNGFCCAGPGACCSAASDCPAQFAGPPTCDDAPACQGARLEKACQLSQCASLPVDDDSACDGATFAAHCGLLADAYCSGAADQDPLVCATGCNDASDCDAGHACVDGACEIDWVFVGNPGNAPDTEIMSTDGTTGYGSVPQAYRISKFEVTNAQYEEFLNAVAATDPNGLYNTNMNSTFGGILRSGSDGSFAYRAVANRQAMPVRFVSIYDALRFANWLQNGRPSGLQDGTTTEDGAYTLTQQAIADDTILRSPGARVFLPSEDEWYKAAFYDPVTGGYFDYQAGADIISCAAPGPMPATANCGYAVNDFTVVGAYTESASPVGTFDQGGNVFEWNETFIQIGSVSGRGYRGGSFADDPFDHLHAQLRFFNDPALEIDRVGFRVASSAPPPVPALGLAGRALLGLALTTLGFAVPVGWRRRRVRLLKGR